MDSGKANIDTATMLAADRTRLSYDRTLMSWVRTAVSLITFGFAIYKFGEELVEKSDLLQGNRPFGSHTVALLMICCGLLALLLATIEHRRNIRALRAQFGMATRSMVTVLAALISCVGIVSLLGVLFRQ
jgi:putative membrane protein